MCSGWDDPRMPTLSRAAPPRLYRLRPSAISWIASAMSKADSVVDLCPAGKLRPRRPWREGAPRYGRAESAEGGAHQLARGRGAGASRSKIIPTIRRWALAPFALAASCIIEQDDFMEIPAKKYQRMFPGNEVRLKGAYIVPL